MAGGLGLALNYWLVDDRRPWVPGCLKFFINQLKITSNRVPESGWRSVKKQCYSYKSFFLLIVAASPVDCEQLGVQTPGWASWGSLSCGLSEKILFRVFVHSFQRVRPIIQIIMFKDFFSNVESESILCMQTHLHTGVRLTFRNRR